MSATTSWTWIFVLLAVGVPLVICIFVARMLVRAIRDGNWSTGSELLARLTSAISHRGPPRSRDVRDD